MREICAKTLNKQITKMFVCKGAKILLGYRMKRLESFLSTRLRKRLINKEKQVSLTRKSVGKLRKSLP